MKCTGTDCVRCHALARGDFQTEKAIGLEVRRRRLARGMSIRDLAATARTGRDSLHAIERGRKSSRVQTLEAIAHALDTTLGELIRSAEIAASQGMAVAS